MRKTLLTALTAALFASAHAQTPRRPWTARCPPQPPATATVTRNASTPQQFTPDKLARLKVPAGYKISVMATELGNARMLHVMPDGGIYVAPPAGRHLVPEGRQR